MCLFLSLRRFDWALPEDYCKKDPCNFNTEMLVSKVGNPCPTLGQLLASRILYVLVVGLKQHDIGEILYTEFWGFPKGGFCEGEILNNWRGARTGCNN